MKKFAIYSSPNGYYYYRYADTLEELEGTGFEEIITEEQLPVVFDGRGGYFKFNENDHDFSRIMESDNDVPLSLEEMYFVNSPDFRLGWISPEGDTYSCSYANHAKCAQMIAKKFYPKARFAQTALDRNGWLQIIDSWDGTEQLHRQFVYTDSGKITRKQADKLFDLGLYKNEEVEKLIAENENEW